MATAAVAKVYYQVPIHTDKIVCRLDLYPELVQALHDGDLLTGRLFCARLFNLDERRSLSNGELHGPVRVAMKSF